MTFIGIVGIVVLFVFSTIRILREYQRGVIFLLGRFWKVKGPGLIIVIPGIQKMIRVDLRVIVMDVPSQDVISRDNVSVKVNAVLYFRIIDPEKAIIQVENWAMATSQLAQTTLRSVLGQHELDDMLAERQKLNADIQAILDKSTDAWGIKVSNVELKHLDLNESMIRAIAAQAEAERARRAKIIHAEGEFQASKRLADADGDFYRKEHPHHRVPAAARSDHAHLQAIQRQCRKLIGAEMASLRASIHFQEAFSRLGFPE